MWSARFFTRTKPLTVRLETDQHMFVGRCWRTTVSSFGYISSSTHLLQTDTKDDHQRMVALRIMSTDGHRSAGKGLTRSMNTDDTSDESLVSRMRVVELDTFTSLECSQFTFRTSLSSVNPRPKGLVKKVDIVTKKQTISYANSCL